MRPTLPEKYYLQHAREVFEFVQDTCSHLLDSAHQKYLTGFKELSEDAQCLLIRCLARKPAFIKIQSCQYAEISNICTAINELTEQRYLRFAEPHDWSDFVHVLTKPQLIDCLRFAQVSVARSAPKAELLHLASEYVGPKMGSLKPIYKHYLVRRQVSVIEYILFLFFGDLRNRFQKFAMRDLGVLRTQKTANELTARFESVDEAQSAFALHQLRRDFLQNPSEVRDHAADYLVSNEAIGHNAAETRSKLLLAVGNEVLAHDAKRAIELWRTSDDPQATERWIREAYKHDEHDTLKRELKRMRGCELPAATKVFIEDFYARKFDGKRTSIYTDMLREPARVIQVDESYLNDVEEGVIQGYRDSNTQAMFTENKLWCTLFALSMWDLLFGESQVQHSEFDRLPALLRNNEFYPQHGDAIERRLALFDTPAKAIAQLTQTATRHYGKPNGIFRWRAGLLDTIIPCVRHSPSGAIAHVLRRMAKNYRHTRDGYPDLMIIDGAQLRFEEVKAPGDVLRPNQLVSINRLRRAGFTVDISQVEWATNPDQVYAVVDIETTGSRKRGAAITEIAVVRVRNKEIISEWSTLVNPQKHVPSFITKLTGINNEMVASAPVFTEIADELRSQLEDSIFVAHNVGFDYGFIKAAYESINQSFRKPKYCTVRNTRRTFPGLKSYSLSNLTQHFDIELIGAHRALNDARATAHLLRLIQSQSAR